MRSNPLIRLSVAVSAVVLCLAAPAAQAQRPDVVALRASVASLQQDERRLLKERADLETLLNPDIVLVPGVFGMPVPLSQAEFTRLMTIWILSDGEDRSPQFADETVSRRLAVTIMMSNVIKQEIRADAMRTIERDLADVRQRYAEAVQRVNAAERPVEPGQPQLAVPPVVGEGWILERAMSGLNDRPLAQVISQSATAAGGVVVLRNPVRADCSETWRMSWTLSPDLNFIYEGLHIRTTLTTELVGRGCNYSLGSYLSVGEGTSLEKFIFDQVPPDRIESRVIESQNLPRAQASSVDPRTSATTSGEFIVRRQPVRWPSYTVLRFYAYTPGTTFTVAYVFRAN